MIFEVLVQTNTADNNKEFARHEIMAAVFDAQQYFAVTHYSQQRGVNTNS